MGFTAKFGLGVAKELIKRGIKGVLKNSKYFLPTRAESLKFGVSLVRYIDPGIEFVSDISKLLPKLMKLNFKGQSKEVKNLIATLEKLQKETSVASESIVKARLPQGGPEVPVKRVDEHLYVQVMNPQGDEFGEYFLLKNNQLEVFKGPVKFSEEQKKQINSVAIKIKDNQRFIDEKNVHPTAYGEGSIRTVLEAGKPNKLLIKMNNQWIPARETPIEGLGVRYDAEIERKLIPVNFNGAEWYFEATTSPFLGKKVSNKIGKKLKRFETHSNPTIFSAPDERGLVRDTSGRSYIKIKNHYVPLILLDKGAERYHLVKKNANSPMTILRFHPEINQFRGETFLEKKMWEAELKEEYAEVETNYHRTGGPSQPGPSQPGPSQPGPSQPGPSQNVPLPKLDLSEYLRIAEEARKLPTIPDRSATWNALRQAYTNTQLNQRRVPTWDLTVQPQRLTNFIPTRPIEVQPYSAENEFMLKIDLIRKDLNPIFAPPPHQPKLDFQVIKGVDTRNSPEFIRPFQVELKKGLDKGERAFLYLKDRCRYLSTIPDISATREGQYLAQMFIIEHAVDKNQILHEINQRLLSIAERGEQILKQTKDMGFENVWIASTDLALNLNTGKYESRLIKDVAQAFIKPRDPQSRMFLIADSFHSQSHPVLEKKQDLFKIILHETTHLGSNTGDLVVYPRQRKGFEMSGSDLLREYNARFTEIINSKAFKNFVYRLSQQQNLPNLSPDAVASSLILDDMLRVNLQMEDAEMIAVIVRDLSERRDFDFRKRVERSLDEQPLKDQPLEDQLATIFRNYAVSSLFDIDHYQLSPHLNKTQDQAKLKITANVKKEEKRSILKVVEKGIEKSNVRRPNNKKSSKLGELAIN